MRSSLTGAPLIHVVKRDWPPREVIVRINRAQGGNPCSGSHYVRLNSSVLARAAAREVGHCLLARVVDGELLDRKIEPVVLRGTGSDDVFGHRRTADRLHAGAGVARREFEDVRLVAQCKRVGIAHQRVKFHRADVVTTLRVVAPTVRANVGASALCITSHRLEGRRWLVPSGAIKEPLGNNVHARHHTQTVENSVFIGLTSRSVSSDNASDVRSMTVLIRSIREIPVEKQSCHSTSQIWMHEIDLARIKTTVGYCHRHSSAIVSQRLRRKSSRAAVSGNNPGGLLVVEFELWRGF